MASLGTINRSLEKEAVDNPAVQERFKRQGRVLLSWAIHLSDTELLGKLGECGIEVDRSSLQQWSAAAGSAEEIARRLSAQGRLKQGLTDINLLWTWAAIAVLWERWFPDSPSFEMFDNRIQDGYDRPDRREGCREWLEAWQVLLRIAEKLQIGTLRAFDERFQGTELLLNWVQDVEMALGDLARPEQDREWFQQRRQFCEELLVRFPNEDKLLMENMRRSWAESLFAIGETDRAEELFRGWLEEDPQWSWGWIGWADNHLFAPSLQRNLKRAEELLREGLAVEGIEERDVFYERLEHLYEEQGRKEEAAKMSAALKELQSGGAASSPIRRTNPKIGRNDPCPCGSGKKFKKCCGA
jgi:tetratricopeptide (TPR) repeat protein